MMSAADCRERSSAASDLADSTSDGALKTELMAISANWSALAVVADWQDAMDAKIDRDRPGARRRRTERS
jgi:hypothetical protein